MAEEYHEEHEGNEKTTTKPYFVLFMYFVVNNRP